MELVGKASTVEKRFPICRRVMIAKRRPGAATWVNLQYGGAGLIEGIGNMKYLIMSAALVMVVPTWSQAQTPPAHIGHHATTRHHVTADRLNAEELTGLQRSSALADGGRKLLVHYYGGTSSIAEYRTWHDCEFVRAGLVGNHPYDIEAAHLDDEVKTAECVQ